MARARDVGPVWRQFLTRADGFFGGNDSKYKIEIYMPNENSTLHYGEVAGDNIRGVTGLGFMQQASICTLEWEVPFETDLPWTPKKDKAIVGAMISNSGNAFRARSLATLH